MVWYFIVVYIINRTLHGHLEIQSFSSVKKHFNRSCDHAISPTQVICDVIAGAWEKKF